MNDTYIQERRASLNAEYVRATQQEEQGTQVVEQAQQVKKNIQIALNELAAIEQSQKESDGGSEPKKKNGPPKNS